jgi:hypothetical protein
MGWLGRPWWYFGISIAIGIFLQAFSRPLFSRPEREGAQRNGKKSTAGTIIVISCWALMVLVLLANGLIALYYFPNNWDSVAYRFARPYLYVGQGNLHHLSCPDVRLSYYPFNGTLIYVFLSVYQMDGRWFNLPTFAIWILAVLACYLLASELGATRVASYLTSCLYMLTPIVMVIATSTNDDVLAAAPLLMSVLFLCRWWRTHTTASAFFASVGAGLSITTKPHALFFGPVALIGGIFLAHRLWKNQELKLFMRRHSAQLIMMIAVFLFLVIPFMAMNYEDAGVLFLKPEVVAPLLNSPFRLSIAAANVSIFTSQLFLSPFPDLVLSSNKQFKDDWYARYNSLFESLFVWVEQLKDYGAWGCRFRGVAAPYGWWAYEHTFWIGLAPFLLLLAIFIFPQNLHTRECIPFWLVLAFFGWHLYRTSTTKYIDTMGVYYSFPFTISAAGLAFLWDYDRKRVVSFMIRCFFVFAIVANIIFSFNALAFNVRRNIPRLVSSHFSPQKVEVDKNVIASLQSSNRIHLVYTRFEFPFFDFISQNPAARYSSSESIIYNSGYLNILLYRARSEYGHIPIEIRNSTHIGLTFLGKMSTDYGNEYVYAHGLNDSIKPIKGGRTLLLHCRLNFPAGGSNATAVNLLRVDGIDRQNLKYDENTEFKLSLLTIGKKLVPIADWAPFEKLPSSFKIPFNANENYLQVQVRLTNAPGTISESFFPLTKMREFKFGWNPMSIKTMQIANCEGEEDWADGGYDGPGTFSVDHDYFTEGRAGARLETGSRYGGIHLNKGIDLSKFIDNTLSTESDLISFDIYVDQENYDVVDSFSLLFGNDRYERRRDFLYCVISKSMFAPGWSSVNIPKTNFYRQGNSDWSQIKYLIFYIRTKPKTVCRAVIDNIRVLQAN